MVTPREPGAPRPRLVSPIVSVALADLDAGRSIRLAVERAHLAVIVGLEGRWPPILVDQDTRRIVDGHYRYLAAERSGWTHIDCEYFHGTADEAFLEAIRRNSGHGLPLTLAERRRVARQLLDLHWEWSDRRIAQTVGLSASTVAVARRASAGGPVNASVARLGRDGRLRTSDHSLVRQRVRSALEAMPHGSLRQIASIARSSPETVRSVRNALPTSMVRVPVPSLPADRCVAPPPARLRAFGDATRHRVQRVVSAEPDRGRGPELHG